MYGRLLLEHDTKKKDVYMWISNVPEGPSMKFLVENGTATISVVL